MTAADFPNINTLTKVAQPLRRQPARATSTPRSRWRNSPDGGTYPVGTIIQLVPQEAMVKRRAGWNPGSNDWEFFSLDVSPRARRSSPAARSPVLNRFGLDCLSCHAKAEPQWDLVCEKTTAAIRCRSTDELIMALAAGRPAADVDVTRSRHSFGTSVSAPPTHRAHA